MVNSGGFLSLLVDNLSIKSDIKGGIQNQITNAVTFSLMGKGRLAIVGRSGCGKTMTAMAILGLLPENCRASGRIFWKGQDLLGLCPGKRRALLGREHVYIPQSGADFLNPSLPVRRQMSESLTRNGIPRRERPHVMRQLLTNLGFDDVERVLQSYPFQLSGGMAQRVVMAMASAGKPELVIADEPTKGIDQEGKEQFIKNMNYLFSEAAILLITHDISLAASCDSILVMRDGRVEEYGEAERVLNCPQSDDTRMLICDLPHAISQLKRGAR